MSVWIAKVVIVVGIVALAVVRVPHMKRAGAVKVVADQRGVLDNLVVAFVSIGTFVPLLWVATTVLGVAEYPLGRVPFLAGVLFLSGGLWLLHRTHVELGTNWSNTLELRETHELIAHGAYRHVRHPVYGALLLHGLGQALIVPNWVAGPLFFVAFAVLVALRLGPEERMMRARFGEAYEAYWHRTTRLVPRLW